MASWIEHTTPSSGSAEKLVLHTLTTAALGPLLWVQGRRVRRTALALPEAAGPREGFAPRADAPASGRGDTPPLQLLILGDSAAAGVGVSTQDEALTGHLVRSLAIRQPVQWRLVARTGRRLSNVLRAATAVASAPTDLVVVSAGINDVLQGTTPARWAEQLRSLADLLEARFQARHVALCGIPRIEQFPLLPQPLAWYLGQRAMRLNRATLAFLPQAPASWRFVPLDLPLQPENLAEDGFHPSALSTPFWAEQVLLAAGWSVAGRAATQSQPA